MIIGLSGKQRAGKDSAVEYLQALYGGDVLPLAREVKQIAECIWGPLEKGDHARAVWQHVGQSMRDFDSYAWLRVWRRTVTRLYGMAIFDDRARHLFVPDIRYVNELLLLQTCGAIVIRLEVTEAEQARRGRR